jgi:hypothetical protein
VEVLGSRTGERPNRFIVSEDDTAKAVVIDEWHLAARVPADLPVADAERVRRTLAGIGFLDRIWWVVRAFPELSAVRLSLAR